MEQVQEHTYESDEEIVNNPNGEEDKDQNNEDKEEEEPVNAEDAATVASSAIDNLSMAPTDILANEYKRLIEQYDTEIQNRKQLEKQVERLKVETEREQI